jgi:uncharacterized RDD family membrane protein YckC
MIEPAHPYRPPQAELDPGLADEVEQLPTAGLGARFLNFVIDNIARMVLVGIVAFVLGLIFPKGEAEETLGTIFIIASVFGYYVILESVFGWTIGKLVTGTRVVRFDGAKPSFPQILGRSFARFIPFEPFSLLFGSSGQGWHDSLSGTRVVRVRR